jgi:hypothetical protein
MKAFFKTLFGDWVNLSFVAIVVAIELELVRTGHAPEAGIVVPLVIMAGIGWLARR